MEKRTQLTVAEVAVMLHCSEKTVYRHLASGNLPFTKLGYRTVRIDEIDLRKFLKRKKGGVERQQPAGLLLAGNDGPYPPEMLSRIYSTVVSSIHNRGGRVVGCRLQFDTRGGITYIAEILPPPKTGRTTNLIAVTD